MVWGIQSAGQFVITTATSASSACGTGDLAPPWTSEHLSILNVCGSRGSRNCGFLMPPLQTEIQVKLAAQNSSFVVEIPWFLRSDGRPTNQPRSGLCLGLWRLARLLFKGPVARTPNDAKPGAALAFALRVSELGLDLVAVLLAFGLDGTMGVRGRSGGSAGGELGVAAVANLAIDGEIGRLAFCAALSMEDAARDGRNKVKGIPERSSLGLTGDGGVPSAVKATGVLAEGGKGGEEDYG